ncbi:MAG TPA: asparagine synthase C-terminal domain-containing protein [Thermodesulfobacteriota bacterium]|nr:asparagine synthase C-terminal domain-containing protein [Thermodesulfobacteriota bacterium]
MLIIENSKTTLKRFHEFKPKSIRYKNDDDYAEHYRELLDKSVACRMRCSTPVSIMLSGGMDSNSIVPFAVKHNPHKKKTRAISWTFNKLQQCDEREYIDKAIEMYDLIKIQFNADDLWPLKNKDKFFNNPGTPMENPYRELKENIYSLCIENGSRLIFNGWYSDRFYAGSDLWLTDLIKDKKISRFINDLVWLIGEEGLFNLRSSQPARNLFSFLKFLKPKRNPTDNYSWLTDFSKSQIHETLIDKTTYQYFSNPKRIQNMLSAIGFFGQSSEHFHLSNHSIELECPYRDIRLVEFMMNIPSYQLYNKGTKKYIAKNAMKNLLPDKILNRNSPTLLTPLFNLGMQDKEVEWIESILSSSDEWDKYIKRGEVLNSLRNKNQPGRKELIVWQCISFINWTNSHSYN